MFKKLLAFLTLGLLVSTSALAVSTDVCFDTDTVLMLHFNGTDGSTTFTDSSTAAHTMTARGSAQLDTAQTAFGSASGLFGGTGDYVDTPDSTDWSLGSGNFTVDFRSRYSDVVSSNNTIIAHTGVGATDLAWDVYGATVNGTIWQPTAKTATAASINVINTWYHFAFVRNGNNITVYKDGVAGTSTDVTGSTVNNSAGLLYIGSFGTFSPSTFDMRGWIDELRVVKGTAVWTANFTPPSAEYCACGSCPDLRRRVTSTVMS